MQAGETPRGPMALLSIVANVVRGALMGLAELVPGVSGGTVALIVGVYERLISSASHVVTALRLLVTGPDRLASFRARLRQAEWRMLLPLLLGMGLAVLGLAGVMKAFVHDTPELARGLFLGMVAASVVVPLLLVDRADLAGVAAKLRAGLVVLGFAVAAFWLTSLGGATSVADPPLIAVFFAASLAICALVLPGVSGSFLMLVLGLYEPTIGAVSERNLGYLAVFAAGAVLGLSLFVKALNWLLNRHHSFTMLAMTGLLLGSLRTLWPWQGSHRELQPVGPDWLPVFGLTLLGLVVVAGLVLADRAMRKEQP